MSRRNIIARATVTDSDIEVTIVAETDGAAIVIKLWVVDSNQFFSARDVCRIGILAVNLSFSNNALVG